MSRSPSSRSLPWPAILAFGAVLLLIGLVFLRGHGEKRYRLAVFKADVTVPMNHGMMGGSWLSKRVADPLQATNAGKQCSRRPQAHGRITSW